MDADVVSFKNLVGVPYSGARDCYWVVREGLLRLGVELPRNSADLLGRGWSEWARELGPAEACRLGDVVAIKSVDSIRDRRNGGVDGGGGRERQHLGLCLNAFQFLHAVGGAYAGKPGSESRIDSLEPWRRAGLIYLRARPIALEQLGERGAAT